MRRVLGVIGHVDHGKTALVRALTGMETDRLAEERRRGISIALGFAHLTLDQAGDPMTIDLIDMPGHERFVRTMVSGATGVDAVLLVVAANEGIKPQTIEHLDIAALLGLRHVIIAISKIDLVEPATAEAAAQATAALVTGLGLSVVARVLTSATTGQGLDALRAILGQQGGAEPADDGFAYLPIDRVFSIAGHGTVVTGTLRRGRLAVSDELELVPAGRTIRLRGLQVHGTRVATALPGQRVAANLRDIAAADIARGVAIGTRGLLPPSPWLTVWVRAVASAPPLPTGAPLHLLFGTEELACRLRLLESEVLEPGQSGLAQLHCAAAASVPARERFILRRPSPPQTVAGGHVLDPLTRRLRRYTPAMLGGAVARGRGDAPVAPAELVRAEIEAAGPAGVPLTRVANLAGISPVRAAEALSALPVVIGRSRIAVLRAEFEQVLSDVARLVAASQTDLPLGRLTSLLPRSSAAVVDDAVADLVRAGTLLRIGGSVRTHNPARDQARATDEASAAAHLAERLRAAGLSPPDPGAIMPGPQTRRLVEHLVRQGVLIRTLDRVQKREVLFHRDAIETAKRTLMPRLASGAGLLVGEAGAVLRISRKYCVPLLEHLDAIHFTRRIADRRVLALQPAK
jgi:selenocysteine-specific elongation factor